MRREKEMRKEKGERTLKQKYEKERNILPFDAGISVKQLSTLFMRPKACLTQLRYAPDLPRMSVGKYMLHIRDIIHYRTTQLYATVSNVLSLLNRFRSY